jgi:membrane protease subunit HflK
MRLLVEGGGWQRRLGSAFGSWWHTLDHALSDTLSMPAMKRGWRLVFDYRRQILSWTLGVAAGLWLISSLTVVGPDQVGVVQRLGRYHGGDLEPGLHVTWPWPIERVTRIQPDLVRIVDVGYRRQIDEAGAAPQVFEWDVRHDEGPVRQVLDESLMLTGDENLVEAYGVVEYSVSDPARYLFGARDPATTVHVTAERTLRWRLAEHALDEILTVHRGTLSSEWTQDLQRELDSYDVGIRVLAAHIEHVHPPVEAVPAYRDVASAQEERITVVNRAEAYTLEQIPLAQGRARAMIHQAEGYRDSRVERSRGEADRFARLEAAHAVTPGVTGFRLYLETIEEVLPGKEKYLVTGSGAGRRRFLFLGSESFDLIGSPAAGGARSNQPTDPNWRQ